MATGYIALQTVGDPNKAPKDEAPLTVATGTGRCGKNTRVMDRFRGPSVRRPISGIEIKEERHAFIQVENTTTGTPLFVLNAMGGLNPEGITRDPREKNYNINKKALGNSYSQYYTDFIVQTITEMRMEKKQVVSTFGDSFLFVYGESPRVISVTGYLCNTLDFNWRAEFWENYDKYFRGTKLVEMGAKLVMSWDDIMIKGYMLNAQAEDNASDPYRIQFGFTLFITDYISLAALNTSVYMAFRQAMNAAPAEFLGGLSIYDGAGKPLLLGSATRRALETKVGGLVPLGAIQGAVGAVSELARDPRNYFQTLAGSVADKIGTQLDKGFVTALLQGPKAGLAAAADYTYATTPVDACNMSNANNIDALKAYTATARSVVNLVDTVSGGKVGKVIPSQYFTTPGGAAALFIRKKQGQAFESSRLEGKPHSLAKLPAKNTDKLTTMATTTSQKITLPKILGSVK